MALSSLLKHKDYGFRSKAFDNNNKYKTYHVEILAWNRRKILYIIFLFYNNEFIIQIIREIFRVIL
jgi:hypothetical protein